VVIYTHGGGRVLGDRETHDRLVRELTVGASVVFVDYDRSPEYRYPVAVEERYAVLKYDAQPDREHARSTWCRRSGVTLSARCLRLSA